MATTKKYSGLNKRGQRVWELLDSGLGWAEANMTADKEFGVPTGDCDGDRPKKRSATKKK